MRRSPLLLAVLLLLAACGTTDVGGDATTTTTTVATSTTTSVGPDTTTTGEVTTTATHPGFPVTVPGNNGPVTIDDRPDSIVSLSATATEMLFAIGAGDQVAAVDDQSNYPEEAPTTDLSAFTPNVEAILSYQPDLVIISYDPGEVIESLDAAGVPVLSLGPAMSLDDTYTQIESIGLATGDVESAMALNASIESELNRIVEEAPAVPDGTDFYHEVDNTYYTATSGTFIGQIYARFGLENIADPAGEDGSAGGFPQLSGEYIVSADPDLIFLANSFYGESAEAVAERPGWDAMTAVREGNIVELDSDIVSRWGPRIVGFAESVSDALVAYTSES